MECVNQFIKNQEKFSGKGAAAFSPWQQQKGSSWNTGSGYGNGKGGQASSWSNDSNYVAPKLTFYERSIVDCRSLRARQKCPRALDDRHCEFVCFGIDMPGVQELLKARTAGLMVIPMGRKPLPAQQKLQILQDLLTTNLTDDQFIILAKGIVEILEKLGVARESVVDIIEENRELESCWRAEADEEVANFRSHTPSQPMHEKFAPSMRTPTYFNISKFDDLPESVLKSELDGEYNVEHLISQFEKKPAVSRPRLKIRKSGEGNASPFPPGSLPSTWNQPSPGSASPTSTGAPASPTATQNSGRRPSAEALSPAPRQRQRPRISTSGDSVDDMVVDNLQNPVPPPPQVMQDPTDAGNGSVGLEPLNRTSLD